MNVFDPEILKGLFQSYSWLFNFSVLFVAGFLTYYFLSRVLWVAKKKNLYKDVNNRSSHSGQIPSLGGIAFYFVFILLVTVFQTAVVHSIGNHLIGAVTIMFMIGVKDDLVISTARVKLIGQIMSTIFIIFSSAMKLTFLDGFIAIYILQELLCHFISLFIIFSPAMKLTFLGGFMGIYEIPDFLGYFITAFIIIAIVNSYNLIDGIDGLAGIIGIVISAVYAMAFSLVKGYEFLVLLSLFSMGTLLAFLRYNFSRGAKKMFMGDSGSLMMGLIIGVLTINLLKINQPIDLIGPGGDPQLRLLFLGAVLFIPFFDTSRVMLVRLLNKRSPFDADRNHLHHILLDLGLSHLQTSAILGAVNLGIVVLYIFLSKYLTSIWLIVSLAAVYGLLFAVCGIAKREVTHRN